MRHRNSAQGVDGKLGGESPGWLTEIADGLFLIWSVRYSTIYGNESTPF